MPMGKPSAYHCKVCGKAISEYSYFHRSDPCNACNEQNARSVKKMIHTKPLYKIIPRFNNKNPSKKGIT